MKNKKRVLTILLILIIILAITLSIVLIFGKKREQEIIENFKKEVETAGCEMAKSENYTKEICENFKYICKIHYEDLIKGEYIKPDLEDPKNHKKVIEDSKSYIEITWKDDKMVCTYIYKEG